MSGPMETTGAVLVGIAIAFLPAIADAIDVRLDDAAIRKAVE